MNSKIKQWLNNPEKTFEDGLAIYEKVKPDTKKDAFFRTAPSFNQGTIQFNILAQELTRISRIFDQRKPEVKDVAAQLEQLQPIKLNQVLGKTLRRATSLKITDVDPEVSYDDLPEEMKVKYDRIKELSKSLGGLKLMLDTATENVERQKIADDLCNSYDERRDLWSEIDSWATENSIGAKTEKKKFEEMTSDELKKEIKLRNDNINRAKKGITEKNKEKTEKKVQSWIGEIDGLNDLLEKQNASA